MLKFPMHGFAKRVDDAVARAMSFLRVKGMDGSTARLPASKPDVWQALARWNEPASIRWQRPSASSFPNRRDLLAASAAAGAFRLLPTVSGDPKPGN